MAVWQIFKVNRRTFFNPSAWINVEGIREANRTIWDNIQGLFVVPTPGRVETFEEAVKRQRLTKADIKTAEQNYFYFAIIFLGLSIFSCLLGVYFLITSYSLVSLLLGIAAGALFIGQAFRFHFWYFQIKHHKLGCTFEEWKRGKPFTEEEPHD